MKKTPIFFLFMLLVATSCGHKQQSDLNNTQNENVVQEETATAEPEEETFTWLSERLVTEDDLAGMNADELRILRNAIFAVHGYMFKSSELQEYFSKFSWYEPLSNDVSGMLNTIEHKNVEFIKAHETSVGYSNSRSYSSSSTSGDVSIDEYLRAYEEYVDKYISLLKRASNGDMTALSEYPSMMSKANDLADKISKVQGSMTNSQVQRFIRIQQKIQDAAQKNMPRR